MIFTCKGCKKREEHHGRGYCFSCYRKYSWKPKPRICTGCRQLKKHHAKGYCEVCYNRTFHADYYRFYSRQHATGVTKAVFEKLDKKCLICGFDKLFDVHHIIPQSKGGHNTLENFAVLCPNHHKMAHHGNYRAEVYKQISNILGRDVTAHV